MRLHCRLLVFISLLLLPSCGEPKADLSATKSHRSGTITFNYPNNWRITEDFVSPEVHYLFLETSGDAIVVIRTFPTEHTESLADFAKEFSKSAEEETPLVNIAGSTFTTMPKSDGYEWIKEELKIDFLGESVPHRRLFGCKEMGDIYVFLILQVATEDYAKVDLGFELVQRSLQRF